jgi:hypothetical protein
MRKIRVYLCLLLGGAAVVNIQPAQAQNLIVNSNFATGDFSGWNVAETGGGGNPADYGVTAGSDGGFPVPYSGDTYGAYFNPSGGVMDLTQTVTIPAAGTYTVSCYVEPIVNDQDILTISLGGVPVLATNFEFSMPYTQVSATFTAAAGAQVLDFQFTPGAGPMFFDDASLVAAAAAPSPCSVLGSASVGAVIGLDGTKIQNSLVTINGDEYVSEGGSLVNMAPSTINGNVFEFKSGQYSGPGTLNGTLYVAPALLDSVNTDALNAAGALRALTPTQTLGAINTPTMVIGNGGENVIDINGNITESLILSGSASDVFFINVSGTINLGGSSILAVTGGVSAGAVLYNLTGSGAVQTHVGNVINGTLLAPNYSFKLDGEFNGAVIGGGKGKTISLLSGAKVNQPDCPH